MAMHKDNHVTCPLLPDMSRSTSRFGHKDSMDEAMKDFDAGAARMKGL
jgi:hypothetical protein